jgi:hypothetical protein
MKLLLIRHLWGLEGPLEARLAELSDLGYGGIEFPLVPVGQRQSLRRLMIRHKLQGVAQICSAGKSVAEHIESFRRQVEVAARFDPVLINSQSGRDAWSEAESDRFFEAVLGIEEKYGVPVAHETHRSRVFYNPWSTSRMLKRFPELKLCCDFSHWVCIAERLIDDQIEIIRQSAAKCIHLHARVGYEQGPQVPDPRAPRYASHLAAHEKWWRLVWEAQRKNGFKVSTLVPEFGPPDYLQTVPFTNMPLAHLEDVCNWQAHRQAENFAMWKRGKALPQYSGCPDLPS